MELHKAWFLFKWKYFNYLKICYDVHFFQHYIVYSNYSPTSISTLFQIISNTPVYLYLFLKCGTPYWICKWGITWIWFIKVKQLWKSSCLALLLRTSSVLWLWALTNICLSLTAKCSLSIKVSHSTTCFTAWILIEEIKPWNYLEIMLVYSIPFFFFFFVFLPILGRLPWHMEVPRPGVESEP